MRAIERRPREVPQDQGGLPALCARIADSGWFQYGVVAVILLNAVVIGLETYDSVEDDYGDLLHVLNDVFLGIFTVEILIRLIAFGRRVPAFFREGWNVFDFIVVAVAYLPWVRESVTLLRIARLLRVTRLFSAMPGLRVVVLGLSRSVGPIVSLSALTFLLLYVYAIIGWAWFGDYDSANFGNLGRALLSCFQILTLEGWNEFLDKEMARFEWAWVYFVSFVLIGTFVVLNLVIAIIVNSMDEVREIERRRAITELAAEAAAGEHPQGELLQRVESLRAALDELERELAASGAGAGEASRERPLGRPANEA
jgi:voltage-gated sodium channel